MMPDFRNEAMTILRYDPETGHFIWLVDRNSFAGKAKAGAIAGQPKDGYVIVGVHRRMWRAHRLAWLFMTGETPPKGMDIDHINCDRSDNRWCNLRLATRSQNNINRTKLAGNNRSGVTGVSWSTKAQRWVARLGKNGKPIILGEFARKEDAIAARKAAEIEHYGHFSKAA